MYTTHSGRMHRNRRVPVAALPTHIDPEPPNGLSELALLPLPWFPKVTAYRLVYSAVTFMLGTTKFSVSVPKSESGSFVAITLEWIAGVVVFLM
jgi:hypothetical protein